MGWWKSGVEAGEAAPPVGDANFQVNVHPAFQLSTVVTAPKPEQNPGFVLSQAETLWTPEAQEPALAVSLVPVTGEAAKVAQNPSYAILGAPGSLAPKESLPAYDIQQVTYTLTRRVGGNASADIAGTWTNRANAEGTNNGSVATSAGAVGAGSRKFRLDYANSVNKGELFISSARLLVYAEVTGDPTGLLSTTTFSYNTGAGETTLEIIAGNFSNLVTPLEYPLAFSLDTWTEYDALQTFVNHAFAAASAAVTCRVDAVEVEIIASKTDLI